MFGEVPKDDSLTARFSVSSFPAVVVLEDALNYKAKVFHGSLKKEVIFYFIQE